MGQHGCLANIGALIVRIGFRGIFYYNHKVPIVMSGQTGAWPANLGALTIRMGFWAIIL